MPLLQDIPLDSVKGIGPKLTEKMNQLGLFNLQDILFFLPYKYQDRSHLVPISQLKAGFESLTQGTIINTQILFARKRMLICHIVDEDGNQLTLRFFHFNKQQQSNLLEGKIIRCFGELRQGRSGLEMIHPEYHLIKDIIEPVEETYTPVYHQIKGLSQKVLQKIVRSTLERLDNNSLEELLPQHIRNQYNYPSLTQALQFLHQPPVDTVFNHLIEKNTLSHQRLAFEELVAHQLSVRYLGENISSIIAPFNISKDACSQVGQFIDNLPFQLTHAQNKVIKEIKTDLNKSTPMLRLLQGDVGSGKTVVAAITILYALSSGFQAVLMAPTELLAEQLYNNLHTWFEPLSFKLSYLSGKIKGKIRKNTLDEIASGYTHLIVGTHALFQQEVKFHKLALVIIDEQHRFGVHQRMTLRSKGINSINNQTTRPHLLVMTATPIPRTLAMTAYADLSCSIINELPPGRKPVKTIIVPQSRREEVISRIYQACKEGKQCYWICTLIEESEVLQCQAAEKTYSDLLTQLTGISIGLVHGRMNNEEKSMVMDKFKNAQIQLLISTTVVEVGVDVPNASLMIIENAERLGLSQLHQLRGRVGRGTQESICALIYAQPISQQKEEKREIIDRGKSEYDILRKEQYKTVEPLDNEIDNAKNIVDEVNQQITQTFDDLKNNNDLNISSLKEAVSQTVNSVVRNPTALKLVVTLKKSDQYSYSHALATSVWCAQFGRQLGLEKRSIEDLSLGGLLLDIGKIDIHDNLLAKSTPLTIKEIKILRSHVDSSVKMLENYPEISQNVMRMVATHHERADGSGYPKGLLNNDIPIFGRIAGIVDSFDAMTSKRPFSSAALTPHEAIGNLYEMRGSLFQPELVEQFIQTVGMYPTGTLVELNTGEIAVVTAINGLKRLKPTVMLILDENKKPYNEFNSLNISQQEGYSIRKTLKHGAYDIKMDDLFL